MLVRLALEEDAEAVIALAALNMAETRPDLDYDEGTAYETFYRYLGTAEPTIFVAEDRREVIGILLASICGYDAAYGHYTTQRVLYVRPDKRGTRAAVLLMKHLISWSQQLGAKEIVGGNDNDFQSDRTAEFLRHFGFEKVGIAMKRVLG